MKPRFSASEVAGLLGLNPYKSRNEVMLKVITMIPKFKPYVLNVKEVLGAKTEREVITAAPPEAMKAMWASVNTACVATSDAEMEQAIQTFKTTHIQQTVKTALLGGKAVESEVVREAVIRVKAGVSTVESELSVLATHHDVISAVSATQEHQVLASEIQKRRGTKLEDKAENNYAVATGKDITERNTFTDFECPDYRLIGYLDGMQDGKVVETKNRKRFWTVPPAYDFVQLRCYMFMKGKRDGVLLENFPGRGPRTTEVPWSDPEWASIHEGLCEAARTIQNMTEEDAQSLAYTVFSATV